MALDGSFIHSAVTHTLPQLIKSSCQNLPILIKVTSGFHGIDTHHQVATGEVYRVNSLQTQPRILCRDATGKRLSVPKRYRLHFQYRDHNGNGSAPYTMTRMLKEWSRHYPLEDLKFRVWDDGEETLTYNLVAKETKRLGLLHYECCYDEIYLVSFPIRCGRIFTKPLLIPSYLPIEVSMITGLKSRCSESFINFLSLDIPNQQEDLKDAKEKQEIIVFPGEIKVSSDTAEATSWKLSVPKSRIGGGAAGSQKPEVKKEYRLDSSMVRLVQPPTKAQSRQKQTERNPSLPRAERCQESKITRFNNRVRNSTLFESQSQRKHRASNCPSPTTNIKSSSGLQDKVRLKRQSLHKLVYPFRGQCRTRLSRTLSQRQRESKFRGHTCKNQQRKEDDADTSVCMDMTSRPPIPPRKDRKILDHSSKTPPGIKDEPAMSGYIDMSSRPPPPHKERKLRSNATGHVPDHTPRTPETSNDVHKGSHYLDMTSRPPVPAPRKGKTDVATDKTLISLSRTRHGNSGQALNVTGAAKPRKPIPQPRKTKQQYSKNTEVTPIAERLLAGGVSGIDAPAGTSGDDTGQARGLVKREVDASAAPRQMVNQATDSSALSLLPMNQTEGASSGVSPRTRRRVGYCIPHDGSFRQLEAIGRRESYKAAMSASVLRRADCDRDHRLMAPQEGAIQKYASDSTLHANVDTQSVRECRHTGALSVPSQPELPLCPRRAASEQNMTYPFTPDDVGDYIALSPLPQQPVTKTTTGVVAVTFHKRPSEREDLAAHYTDLSLDCDPAGEVVTLRTSKLCTGLPLNWTAITSRPYARLAVAGDSHRSIEPRAPSPQQQLGQEEEEEVTVHFPMAPPSSPCRSIKLDDKVRLPNDLSTLSVKGVSSVLKQLNMAEYAECFLREQVDGSLLMALTQACLVEDFHFTKFKAIKLIQFVQGWRPQLHR